VKVGIFSDNRVIQQENTENPGVYSLRFHLFLYRWLIFSQVGRMSG